jgi:transposase
MITRESKHVLVHSLYEQGYKQEQISKLLSISQGRVSQLLKHPKDIALPQWGGHKQCKLSDRQKEALILYLEQGAEHFGFEGDLWNSKRVKQVIAERLGVSYHVDHIPDLLKTLGFSLQKPKLKDYRHKPQEVEKYKTETLAELKKKQKMKQG